jgi:transcriptional regulator with XRE-family HTH domain
VKLPLNCYHCGKLIHHRVGIFVRAQRKKKGKSLRSVATLMDVSAPYLCNLELGWRPWNEERVKEVLRAIAK